VNGDELDVHSAIAKKMKYKKIERELIENGIGYKEKEDLL
jgi:hypothetical protein